MDVIEYAIDVFVQKLNEYETKLSDECYEYLNSFEGAEEDVMIYHNALNEYLLILKDRFWCDEEDEKDEQIIKKMLMIIYALISAMTELEQTKPSITIDED